MEPNVEDAAVTPTDVPLSYPCFSIAGMKILPTPAVSAWEEPEIPAKIMDTSTFELARPPRRCPTKELQQSISFSVISPSFIRFAARINSGTANSVKLFRPLNIFWNTTKFGICPRDAIPVKDTTPSANEIGTPMATKTINITTNKTPITCCLLS